MTSMDLKSLSVLVVDDDKFMREMIDMALRGLEVEKVETAADGREALEILDRLAGNVDVLLCDLNMPGMDGIEFLRHLAERRYAGGIVVASGETKRILAAASDLAQARNLRILGSLEKPISQVELGEMLSRAGTVSPRETHKLVEAIGEEELRRGLDGNELAVFFQPKVEVATRKIRGVEALVRWNHPRCGIVGPEAFVPAAEKCGLILPLTHAVFVKAMKQGGAWCNEGLDLKVAVNISMECLDRYDLPELLVSLAIEHGMDPTHVILEVTESRLMQDIPKSLEILSRLRLKGIGLSIDDFGTGYSSLEQLQRIPFGELKIDRLFVSGARRDPAASAILESSIRLARQLGMETVAEGVETEEDWSLVEQLGCDHVQGYFVAKPMPAHEVRRWMSDWYLGGRTKRIPV
jgi:EAL domain-containing protein (putative c-di-GMP-specific phosphodiesterase class I)/AmiR/NasT family two-component response regulator